MFHTLECLSQGPRNHLLETVIIKEDRASISQFFWKGRSLTSVGALLQGAKIPPIMKMVEVSFPLD